MINRRDGRGPRLAIFKFCLTEAAAKGQLQTMKWLGEEKLCELICIPASSVARNDKVVKGGQFRVVKWLFENCSKDCSLLAPKYAATNEGLETLQWLHRHFNGIFSSDVMDEATTAGHLDVVKWLYELRTEGCSTVAMDGAAACDYLEVVQWLHENRNEGCTAKAMNHATDPGHLDV
ncbi:hypothetical protein PHMEG_00010941 [Phytophthora megakarya]|uniref:Uncharacterized protein n=1 Tax=Phytophthora megakarya TaxID=4795 RepID=A0A225WE52_9STRA|nr:hypothetical protein PHMEG_00010941 [Phytophthora megakarya]